MTRDDVLAILRSEAPRLREEFGVESLTLFGSFARGRRRPIAMSMCWFAFKMHPILTASWGSSSIWKTP